VYAHATWSLTDHTRIIAGIRYSEEQKSAHYQLGPAITPNEFSTLDETLPLDFSAVTPMFELEHAFTPDVLGYASASKGYASGGYSENPSALTRHIATYAPESLWSYEVGLKSELFNHALRFNVAAFLMNYDNIVIQSYGVSPINGGVGIETTNSGRVQDHHLGRSGTRDDQHRLGRQDDRRGLGLGKG
jgi:iron complex outermembrane recepter protein